MMVVIMVMSILEWMGYMDGDIFGNDYNLEEQIHYWTYSAYILIFCYYLLRCISIKYVGVYGVGGWVCIMVVVI